MRWGVLVGLATVSLAGCADPHFIHDPQIGYFSKSQMPPLLKSLRCELATYIAANNQRHIINKYLFKTEPLLANQTYPFFPIEPSRFGGMSLELKVQDSLGTQAGTAFDWKRTASDALHSRVWHIGPTLGTQNSYDLLASYLLPQDIYGFETSEMPRKKNEFDLLNTSNDEPYLCYKSIPYREPAVVPPSVYNAEYVLQDLDAVAKGEKGEAQFDRIRVNAGKPLAAWLLDVGTTLTTTSITYSNNQFNEAILPGQQIYTFTIQTTAGLDVKNVMTTTLWTAVGGEVSGQWQHTGTLSLYFNGSDAPATSGVKGGSTVRSKVDQTYPVIKTRETLLHCPMPVLGAPSMRRGRCSWSPPYLPTERYLRQTSRVHHPSLPQAVQMTAPAENKKIEGAPATVDHPAAAPAPALPPTKPKPTSKPRAPATPAFRDFGAHGRPEYPTPLSPMGTTSGF